MSRVHSWDSVQGRLHIVNDLHKSGIADEARETAFVHRSGDVLKPSTYDCSSGLIDDDVDLILPDHLGSWQSRYSETNALHVISLVSGYRLGAPNEKWGECAG